MIESLAHFFKPEIQNAAAELVAKGAVYLKIGSDTQIDASIRGTTPVQVAFRSETIESSEFTVDCSCKASSKGQLCKHIWATLLVASEKSPDFFAEKTSITKADTFAAQADAKVATTAATRSPEAQQRQIDFKQKQADYRKQAYQMQKARLKERSSASAQTSSSQTLSSSTSVRSSSENSWQKSSTKSSAKSSKANLFLPSSVAEALQYFEANGFPMSLPVDDEALNSAKRVLSRVFHPDKGGSQDEMIELLHHAEILLKHR